MKNETNSTNSTNFMSLKDFLLLKEFDRSIHRNDILSKNIRRDDYSTISCAEDLVYRYELAKEAWDKFGGDGPPVGSNVRVLINGHGGSIGCERVFGGVYLEDDRFFYLYKNDELGSTSLVNRKIWFASIEVLNENPTHMLYE